MPLAWALALLAQADGLDEKIRPLLPRPGEERWLEAGWRLDFAAARAEANRDGKPLFLWMMDGHPMGCT